MYLFAFLCFRQGKASSSAGLRFHNKWYSLIVAVMSAKCLNIFVHYIPKVLYITDVFN
jgi:hypothetical protein